MRIAIVAATVLLAACGSSDNAATPAPDQSYYATETEQPPAQTVSAPTIRKISDAELATALGSECPAVTKSEYKGKTDDQVFYAVQCGSREILLGINFDGSTKGVPCSLAETLNTPCWTPWPESDQQK